MVPHISVFESPWGPQKGEHGERFNLWSLESEDFEDSKSHGCLRHNRNLIDGLIDLILAYLHTCTVLLLFHGHKSSQFGV